ncbi:hypothetical protein RB3247 [Rhodopirellula baltica SH 1]|uniref:Uncharacterized protein n=1 Tax=Rhodopirellula baltica (strain DSM 10527 / NCIMB 13988 / SH1) TaxID=243090 RepID=Q7UUK2_RHOBA|nr:hypothetical protein RB3247 [Rhodopirellula baltica SH 1]
MQSDSIGSVKNPGSRIAFLGHATNMPAFFGGNGTFADQIEDKSWTLLSQSEEPAQPDRLASPMYSHRILAFQDRTNKIGPKRISGIRPNAW